MQHIVANVNASVGINTNDMRIVCRVMNLAEPESVGNDRFALWMPVVKNVCGIEQLNVLEPANGALFSICHEDHSTELLLMEAL